MSRKSTNTRHMVLAGIFAALMAVCAWTAVPIPPVAFTLQTFGVFLSLVVLGGKWGCVSILLYLLLGLVGLPVFSGFQGGAAALMNVTGGFLWGFLVAGLVYWGLERLGKLPAMVLAMVFCYACGCWWFTLWAGNASWRGAFLTCVAPYLLFDGAKLWLAWTVGKRIRRNVKMGF